MRVLMLTDLYPPVIGGLELHVRNLSAGLTARGHSVAVATLAPANTPSFEVDDHGVRVYRMRGTLQRVGALFSDSNRRFAPPCPDPEALRAIRRIIVEERPDIVHAHNWLVHSYLPLKRWSQAKLVVSLHDYSLACARKDRLYRGAPCDYAGLDRCLRCGATHFGVPRGVPTVLLNRAWGAIERANVDYFLPVSDAVARGNGLVDRRQAYRVIPNFIPDDIATAHGASSDAVAQLPTGPFLLFVGALLPAKGITVLLEAYARLRAAPPLVLIGATWPTSPTTFPPGVVVLRDWPHAAVMEAWRRSAIGLVPSIWGEPCPTVALEAMAAGCPIIASRIGGLTDIVAHQRTGLLVAPGDAAAWAGAIQGLLDDPPYREALGRAGRQRAQAHFVASAVLPQVEAVYGQLLNTAPVDTRPRTSGGEWTVRENRAGQ